MTLRHATSLLTRTMLCTTMAVGAGLTMAGPAAAEAPAPQRSVAKFETDFMADTIMHHNLAIEMGELCLAEATGDDQLPQLCASVVESQTAQREQLQAWLQAWYGLTPPGDDALPPNGDETLAKLGRYSGEEFDTEMAETFVRHHYTFLPDADKCRDTAFHEELAALCNSMYEEQTAQIPQFRAVVAESSGREQYGPKGSPGGVSTRGKR